MPTYNIASGLPSLPSGLTDKDAALVVPLYLAISRLAQVSSLALSNVTYSQSELTSVNQLVDLVDGKQQVIYVKASEALGFGQLVHITIDSGKFVAQLADSTIAGRRAHGICDVPGGIAVNDFGKVLFMQGLTAGVNGTAMGTTYYLANAGTMAAGPSGVINQKVALGMGSAGAYLKIEI